MKSYIKEIFVYFIVMSEYSTSGIMNHVCVFRLT